jgi:hypothetical protein
MRPLAAGLRTRADALGITQYLTHAYYGADRSLWAGVRRLQPGQSLTYNFDERRLTLAEHSTAWRTQQGSLGELSRLADEFWSRLSDAVRADDIAYPARMIMCSGGWDSRTLLATAVAFAERDRILAYTHGDPASREVEISHRLAAAAGIAFHQAPIDFRCFALDLLNDIFRAEEHVSFPHWARAGAYSAGQGSVISAGVFGEVAGGHYGSAMLMSARRKGQAIALELLGLGAPRPTSATQAELVRLVTPASLQRPWVVNRDWWAAANVSLDQWRDDARLDFERLSVRGVEAADQLIEAYVTEHRGSQYIAAQLRASRTYSDVEIPFGQREAFEWATTVPYAAKVHNRLNQSMLRSHAAWTMAFPMAATLAKAHRPLLVQEASRLVRRTMESVTARSRRLSGLAPRPPRLSWVNFEFLRPGRELHAIVDDLQGELWDRAALRDRINQCAAGAPVSMHSMADHLLKLYTLDLGMRLHA